MAARVFMSYSHKDEALRDQLEVQLAMLKRQGLIEVWHDRRLSPGDHFDVSIHEELDAADVILLLVSPDFLASDYCYRIEKARALARHRRGEARVISVILRPCEWQQTALSRYLVTPTDGRPVTRWPDLDDALLDVAKQIRRAIEQVTAKPQSSDQRPLMVVHGRIDRNALPRSGNLRLRKTFTKADKDRFRDEAFDFIERFFRGSLEELAKRNDDVETRHRNIDSACFVTSIYLKGDKVGACTIRMGTGAGDITYRDGDSGDATSFNESLSVEFDDQKLFLRPLGMRHFGSARDAKSLSKEGAAEYLWSMLIEPLQGE